ncbi:MAG: hypothetical protein A3H42_00155 [Deltaproteobacteria bacterium RIFCSPLOWO2_02_FULL_46_8]|nr:MAG: hypothetical protein A3H42_00155 [Deltaproteobacteria bacterium RIFCSPLOWO2_02_FULL_46_8]
MGRNAFCSLVIKFILLLSPISSYGNNRAAEILAGNFYEKGNYHVAIQEWKKGIWNYELARFLDPNLAVTQSKIKNLTSELQKQSEQFYLEGLRSYQSLRFNEANLQWQMALQSVVEPQSPIKQKIETALILLKQGIPAAKKENLPQETPDPTRGTMEEVRSFLEKGEPRQAALVLKESLRHDEKEERSENLLNRLQSSLSKDETSQNLSEAIQKQFEAAQKLLTEAKNGGGYPKYKEALALFKPEDLKPPFYREMEEGFKESAAKLNEQLKPLLKNWETALQKENPNLEEIGLKLKKVLSTYPPSEEAVQLLQKVYALLQKKSEPLLMEAKTVQELEGCLVAKPFYEKAKKTALFTEVPVWQEAHKNLEAGVKIH